MPRYMAKETYIIIPSEEDKSKQVIQAISTETSRKILDFMINKQEASSSQLSERLNIQTPIIESNLRQLNKAGVIEGKDFVQGEKGKEVLIYRLAKKIIIISPRMTHATSPNELRNVSVVAVISAAVAGIVYLFYRNSISISPKAYSLWFLFGALFALIIISILKIK